MTTTCLDVKKPNNDFKSNGVKCSPENPSKQSINQLNAQSLFALNKEKTLARDAIANKVSGSTTTIDSLLDIFISSASAAPKAKIINDSSSVPIPSAPLYHLVKAKYGSQDSFNLLQSSIDSLDKKAQAKTPFKENEKEFLKELYEAFWYGGTLGGMPEAGKLANHYVNGSGSLVIDSQPYTSSVIVNDTTDAMKAHIRDLAVNNKSYESFKTDDTDFRNSEYFNPLMRIKNSRNITTQGYVMSDGLMFSEKGNERLQKVDNRFYLKASTTKLTNGNFQTTWRVDNVYDFEPYEKFEDNKFTKLPLGENMKLILPDGLSEYMDSGLGISKPFDYYAQWVEEWK